VTLKCVPVQCRSKPWCDNRVLPDVRRRGSIAISGLLLGNANTALTDRRSRLLLEPVSGRGEVEPLTRIRGFCGDFTASYGRVSELPVPTLGVPLVEG